MQTSKEHFVDAGEQDTSGLYDYYYAYWLYSFREGQVVLIARSYDDEPLQAHFLRKELEGRPTGITPKDMASPLFRAACDYLRQAEGKERIAALRGQGYMEVALFPPTDRT